MLEFVGHEVLGLVRIAIGPVRDPALRPGEWRMLSLDEVRALYRAAGAQA
jgi:16S rRNA U516 pseudouridylate synthase RsuA-like enzyme